MPATKETTTSGGELLTGAKTRVWGLSSKTETGIGALWPVSSTLTWGCLQFYAGTTSDELEARYYNNNFGRFWSVDPKRHANLAKPQSWNQYLYTSNDPVNRTDPSGLDDYDPIVTFTTTVTGWSAPGLGPADEFALMEFLMGGDPPKPNPNEEFGPDPGEKQQAAEIAATLNRIYAAIPAAISALKNNPICSALFNLQGNAPDPATLLTEIASGLFAGAYFTVGDTDSNSNAETYRTQYSAGPDGTIGPTGVLSSTVTVFNYASNTPFNNGTVTANATTILHELGHVYEFLYGPNSTMIADDSGNNLTASKSNTALISSTCFGGQ